MNFRNYSGHTKLFSWLEQKKQIKITILKNAFNIVIKD